MKAKDLIKELQKNGFELARSKGSHHIFKHSDGRRTTVPLHGGDMPTGTYKAIIKQSGIPDPEKQKGKKKGK
ncbi:addiction module toxin, HicA family protein (plasmid) [Marivirga tractuosa]|uniref:YcfA family protein n=1 Tax=Marivirga tractuosa (strain ATCC 23168 / DSM 4126 / NBRC 15989 / NCIMB 1408 / VKM B-1430 / H-43) TaxID=643867 RepID=E4TW48_MARTH|nr:type II toxin-antitoxin system HicA family toxin [Marivirga tractuosa]ADR23770.1 YcfA family protein [Marivirga tractuosa DSM 4126]BDD16973.1 addiction module toxin, HicA family protein [Marivirga tractuosa]